MNDQSVVVLANEDAEAAAIGELWRRARASVTEGVKYAIEAGRQLTAKKASLAHGQWLSWLETNAVVLGFGISAANKLMKGSSKFVVDYEFGDDDEALAISREIWGNKNIRGTQGTGENEWFTPEEHVELVRKVLGEIDLDPASHKAAQKIIQAKKHFTKADDGLSKEWHGRVYLNPPYAQPLIAQFTGKMCEEFQARRVRAAIMLTHNYTDTSWFQSAVATASAVCFTRGRIKFYEPDGAIAAPTQGQAFFYFGRGVKSFAATFSSIGFVMVPA